MSPRAGSVKARVLRRLREHPPLRLRNLCQVAQVAPACARTALRQLMVDGEVIRYGHRGRYRYTTTATFPTHSADPARPLVASLGLTLGEPIA